MIKLRPVRDLRQLAANFKTHFWPREIKQARLPTMKGVQNDFDQTAPFGRIVSKNKHTITDAERKISEKSTTLHLRARLLMNRGCARVIRARDEKSTEARLGPYSYSSNKKWSLIAIMAGRSVFCPVNNRARWFRARSRERQRAFWRPGCRVSFLHPSLSLSLSFRFSSFRCVPFIARQGNGEPWKSRSRIRSYGTASWKRRMKVQSEKLASENEKFIEGFTFLMPRRLA